MNTVQVIKLLVGSMMVMATALVVSAMAMGDRPPPAMAMLTVVNETPHRVEVRVEGSEMCYLFDLQGSETSMPIAIEHEGAVMVSGVVRGEFGNIEGYWPMTAYRLPPGSGTSELIVRLTEAEMMPPD